MYIRGAMHSPKYTRLISTIDWPTISVMFLAAIVEKKC